jgi:hypothetical protein
VSVTVELKDVRAKPRDLIDELLHELVAQMNLATWSNTRIKKRRAYLKKAYIANHLTEEQLRYKYKVDYDLNDAIDDYRFHCSEVQRLSAMINTIATVTQSSGTA